MWHTERLHLVRRQRLGFHQNRKDIRRARSNSIEPSRTTSNCLGVCECHPDPICIPGLCENKPPAINLNVYYAFYYRISFAHYEESRTYLSAIDEFNSCLAEYKVNKITVLKAAHKLWIIQPLRVVLIRSHD